MGRNKKRRNAKQKNGQPAEVPVPTQHSGTSETEADVMKRELAIQQNAAAPINRFAREVLAEIFWHCLPKVTGFQMPSRKAPFLLCRVCSSWRVIALNTPKLWNTVAVTIRHLDRNPSIINTWLERSGTLPLGLYLQFRSGALLETILSMFYSHSTRWQRVFLILSVPSSLSLPQLDTPLLRSFIVEGNSDAEEAILLPFNDSPHLKQLHWPFPINVPENPQIRWSQMANLRISSGMTFFTALETIRLCPQLEKFDVDVATASYKAGIDRTDDTRLPLKPVVENCSLKILKLLTFDDCSPLLDSLALPALKDFTFEVFIADELGGEEPRHMLLPEQQAFLSFLTRSECQLDRLKLGHCAFTASAVIECLEHKSLETLQAFTIAHLYYQGTLNDTVLTRLTIPSSPPSQVLLPKLVNLTFELCLRPSSGALGRMVHSRRCSWKESGTVQLKSFSVVGKKLGPEDDDLISKAVADGLHASIQEDPCYGVDYGSDYNSD